MPSEPELRAALAPFAALRRHFSHFVDPDDDEPRIEVEILRRDVMRACAVLGEDFHAD